MEFLSVVVGVDGDEGRSDWCGGVDETENSAMRC